MADEEIRMSLAVVKAAMLGSLIGIERGWAGRPAGIRTMSLVGMGSCLFTVVGRLSYSDQARIAAQIASGVGFLGAGVIHLRDKKDAHSRGEFDYLKGLMTAAAIWLVAGVGVACGCEHFILASVATFLTSTILFSYRLVYGQWDTHTHPTR